MKEEYPHDEIERIHDEAREEIWGLIKMWYGFGLVNFGLAILFLVVATPKDRWMIVHDLNIMVCALAGAYWITKAEDLRKTLK